MNKQLVGFNIVITANNFNPTVFNQVWLYKNKIATEEDFKLPGNVIADGFTQISAENFVIIITPQQLQFIPRNIDIAFGTIKGILVKLIELIPQTPFIGIDINFDWHFTLDTSFHEYTKSKFWNENNPFLKHFATPDCSYGYYISKNIEEVNDVRLKLNIKPIQFPVIGQESQERLQLLFNYHKDYKSEDINRILTMLQDWDKLYNNSDYNSNLLFNE